MIIHIVLVAAAYLAANEKIYLKYEGSRTKVYGDTIVRKFEIYCGKWFEEKNFSGEIDSVKKCHSTINDGKSFIDSVTYKSGFFDMFECIYDNAGHKAYSILTSRGKIGFHGNSYSIDRYELGRLVSSEDWCDTIGNQTNPHCRSLLEERENSIKQDSLGRFLTNQIRYVWDGKGRLKQRILWELNNPYGLNGTYEFIYKSPCDPVKVVPEDREWGWDAMQKGRYDGTFGKIPEVGDPEYKSFAEDPYPESIVNAKSFSTPESQKAILERQKKRCEDYKKSKKYPERK